MLEQKIEEIIKGIPHNRVFDTHTIINILQQKHSDIYLSSYSNDSTELYHGKIGQMIAKLAKKNPSVIDMLPEKSWSINMHNTYSDCACWKKN